VGGQKSDEVTIQEGVRASEPVRHILRTQPSLVSVCVVGGGYVGVMHWKRTIGELEADLVGVEAKITMLRSEQLVLVHELESAQAPQSDASMSMVDWVQTHLDIKRDTAQDLVFASRRFGHSRGLHDRMLYRGATFDRTVAAVKLADSGALPDVVAGSYGHDLGGVRRLTARTRHITPGVEREVFSGRYFTIQPNLDESRYRMWGEAPGIIGRTIDKAVSQRADQLRTVADELPTSRGQSQLDALGAMALDSLDRDTNDAPGMTGTGQVTVFLDARQDNPQETAAMVEYGPRVGPDALEQIQCTGRVQIVGLDAKGLPVVTSRATRTIPPAIRHTVAYRDGSCVIDGCVSLYRLQPHHIRRFADGGSHHPDNLATLCWYHHHVAIHGNGYHIDPQSPPHRRRLTKGPPKRGPPPMDSDVLFEDHQVLAAN
jgi:hypothetical protein